MKKALILLLFVSVIIGLGYFRDFVFVNTNSILYTKYYNTYYPLHPFFHFFLDKSYNFIYISKWIITAIFIAAYFIVQVITSKILLNDNFMSKWFFIFYVFLVILSIITFAVGWIVGSLNQGYIFSRLFLGILQSPLPIMFLLPVYYFTKKLNHNLTHKDYEKR
jgi:hypothetical protein